MLSRVTPRKNVDGFDFKVISGSFEQLVKQPIEYLKPQLELVEPIYHLIRQSYAICLKNDVEKNEEITLDIVTKRMDDEQIWQQLELRNNIVLGVLLTQASQLIAENEENQTIYLKDIEDLNEKLNEHEIEVEHIRDASEISEIDYTDDKSETKLRKTNQKKKKEKSFLVDDTFFKLNEMNVFLEKEDAKEMRKQMKKDAGVSTDIIDHFAEDFGVAQDSEDNNDDANANFADFFEKNVELQNVAKERNGSKHNDFLTEKGSEIYPQDMKAGGHKSIEIDKKDNIAESEGEPTSDTEEERRHESENEDVYENKERINMQTESSNDMREARLLQRIRDYEDVVLGEKSWQLKGEVQAENRPQNSLLEEILEFDSTTRPSAPMTDEQNRTIEDIIKQRIRDKVWDDVERTIRPVHTPQEYRKNLILDQEKCKHSLGQVYETLYHRELNKLNPNWHHNTTTMTPLPQEHKEIKAMMNSLLLKLDALSNFHFTPKPVAPEARIITNTPAINIEEVAPIGVSNEKLLAPEEVFRGPKHSPLGKSERTRTDKNREKRKKRQKQRVINSISETREKDGVKEYKSAHRMKANTKLLKTVSKNRKIQKISFSTEYCALKSSKTFFSKLQEQTSSISNNMGNKRHQKDVSQINAKKIKL